MAKELVLRISSGVVLAALALWCTLTSPLTFQALALLVGLLMYREWLTLTTEMPPAAKWAGVAYVALPVWALIALRQMSDPAWFSADLSAAVPDATTPFYVLFLFAVVWGADSGAYVGGKWKGKHLLAPSISPGKTWEGLGFGVATAALLGLVVALSEPDMLSAGRGFAYGALLAVVGQCGDLFESWLKRRAGVKDSGTLIPGHGGVLDRVDALAFAAPVFAALVMF